MGKLINGGGGLRIIRDLRVLQILHQATCLFYKHMKFSKQARICLVEISKKAQIMLVICLFFVHSENERFPFQYFSIFASKRLEYLLRSRLVNMLMICFFFFTKPEPEYAYKRYANKKNMYMKIFFHSAQPTETSFP